MDPHLERLLKMRGVSPATLREMVAAGIDSHKTLAELLNKVSTPAGYVGGPQRVYPVRGRYTIEVVG